MTRISLVREGWEPAAGDCGFYPADLPAEWRLTYFANETDSVLLPLEQWLDAPPALLARWREDTPAWFRFYLHLGRAHRDTRTLRRLEGRLEDGLGDRLGGWVRASDQAREALAPLARPHYRLATLSMSGSDAAAPAGPRSAERLAYEAPPDLSEDPRAAGVWLSQVGARVGRDGHALVLLGRIRLGLLQSWRQLAELSGLA